VGLPHPDELVEHLVRLLGIRVFDPLEILLESSEPIEPLRELVRLRARRWASVLLGTDPQAALMQAIRLVSALYPGDEVFDPPVAWWRTPLGRVVAWQVGHPTATALPYPVAGAMLGMTRQGVHDLVTRGKLVRHPDGGVTTDSVRARLHDQR
jgi:hypothetical protein